MSERERDVLVIGASGLVGSSLMRRLRAQAFGTYRTTERPGLLRLDVTDHDAAGDLIADRRPRAIVHCAAYTHVDGCEQDPDRSRVVNVDAVRNVAEAAAKSSARMVFLSTDYVFGEGGPHRLDEEPAPLNVYGRHKLEAERIVTATVEGHAIVRSCNVYGYQRGGKNFVMAVLESARAGRRMRAPADQWGNPTLADDLADAVAEIVCSMLAGTFHLAGPDYVDRPTWARSAAKALGLDPGFIEFVPTNALGQPARRPLRAGLDSRESCARLGARFKGVSEGAAAVAAQAQAPE